MKKKLTALFLVFVSICIMVLQPTSLALEPDSTYTLGLENDGTYYIKNRHDGGYLSVQSSIDANGTNVCSLGMSSIPSQKWKLISRGIGVYTLKAVFSNSDRVLNYNSSTSNINIWSYNSNSSNQKFTVTRVSSGSYAGLYTIKNGSNYVSLASSGNNILATSTFSLTKCRWSFIPVTKGDADLYNFANINGYGVNTTGCGSTFRAKCQQMGYSSYVFSNKSASLAYGYLQRDSVFVFAGHGGVYYDDRGTGIYFGENQAGASERIISGNSSSIYEYSVLSLPSNALKQERAVLYLGCHTGVTCYGHNLVDNTFAKGAHFVLGTKDIVFDLKVSSWIKSFFIYANKGYTIRQCINYANYKASLGSLYYVGDADATLKY